MSIQRKAAICDCDHAAMEEERQVFAASGVKMDYYQCKTEDQLIETLGDYEVVGTQYAPFTDRVFSALNKLKIVVRYGVGVDNIDIEAATRHGVRVCNVPDYGVQEVSSHALLLMMALVRKLLPIDRSVRAGDWKYQVSMPVPRFSTMTMGIVGLGRIGRSLAGQLRGLGVRRILAADPLYPESAGEGCDFVEMTSLERLLAESDVVSLHCPLESSGNLIGEAELKQMKKSAYLINVSRGGIVNEGALEKALEEGWIAGAACDVLSKEPPSEPCPLLRFDNFILTPHMAWYSEPASSDLKRKLAEEMVRHLDGQPLLYVLNKEL